MELSKLAPVRGSRHRKKRVGCGESSGHGKTCGRGGKGQTARTGGGVRAGFEGGQMPLYRRLPKYGFTSQEKVSGRNVYAIVNVADLEEFTDGATVDQAALKSKGFECTIHQGAGIKILGSGDIKKKLHVKVHAISAAARAKIEQAGGTVELLK